MDEWTARAELSLIDKDLEVAMRFPLCDAALESRVGYVPNGMLLSSTFDLPNPYRTRTQVMNDGVPLRVYEFGDASRPCVVFISIGLPICTFYGLMEELAQRFHVVSWDSRGYPSFNDNVERSNLSVARHVEDFAEIVNHVGRRRVRVVSYSAGSTVAVRAAVTHRGLIERMVLIGGSFNLPEALVGEIPQYQSRRLYQKMTLSRDEAEAARHRFLLNLKQGGKGIQAKGDPRLEALKYCVEFMFESREAAFRYANLQIGLSKENVVDLLPQVSTETLVSVASDDQLGCLAANVYVSEHLPRATLKAYEGAGHWSVYLHRTMLRDVGKFLAGEAI